MYTLKKSYKIKCSYRREGKDKPLIKETFKVVIQVKSKELKRSWVVIEPEILDNIYKKEIHNIFTNKHLNDTFGLAASPSYFARDIAMRIDKQLPTAVDIDSVALISSDGVQIKYDGSK